MFRSASLKICSALKLLFLFLSLYLFISWNYRSKDSVLSPSKEIVPTSKDDADELPSVCRKYFDPSFPINLTKAIERNLGRGHTKLFAKDEIMRPLCENEYKTASIMLVYNNTLHVHNSRMQSMSIHHLEIIQAIYQQQRRAFPNHNFANVLFKWWGVDNPVDPCTKKGAQERNVVGTVGWSRCPPPYCAMSIVVPSLLPGEAKEGRMQLQKTFSRLGNCTSIPMDKRPAHAEWHGTSSGYRFLPFWDAPSEQCFPPQCQWNSSASMTQDIGRCRKKFVEMFENSALPVNVSYTKRDICAILSENRLLYSVAGYSYASNFYDNMLSGAVTLKQDYPAWSYFEPFFEPDEHYILGRRDLSDFEDISRLVLELSPEDVQFSKFRQMAQSARERATLLATESPLLQNCFYNELFRKYSSMLAPEATAFHSQEWTRLEI